MSEKRKKEIQEDLANYIRIQQEKLRQLGEDEEDIAVSIYVGCLLYTSPSPRDKCRSRMPSSA